MHEYIEIQFRRKSKPFRLKRQIATGFEFEEPDPPTRSIDIGFAPFDDGTKIRMNRIRQVKGWPGQEFTLRASVEDGSLVLRGADEFSLPEGFYNITANVDGAKAKKRPPRVEIDHDDHGVVTIDLEMDERTIEVDLDEADDKILGLLAASEFDGVDGISWVADDDIRPGRRACFLNLLAMLRITPTLTTPLIDGVLRAFHAGDERTYVSVTPGFFDQVVELAESHDKVYPEGAPHADIHRLLIDALCIFEPAASACFDVKHLLSFRAEGSPSLQMVIAVPTSPFAHQFADLDLDLGNPLQDIAGFAVHIGELLSGKPTNHLDLWKKLKGGKAKPYLYYKVLNA
jgi:hypothetical protein